MAQARPSMRDRVREEAKNSITEGAGYLNIPKGITLYQSETEEGAELDVIPYENNKKNHPKGYEVGELIPYFRFKIHKNIGADNQSYVCPTTFGKPCPVCKEVQIMRKSSSGDAETIKSLAAKDRAIMQVIDLKDRKNDSIQIWEDSYHAFLKKLLTDIDASENSDGTRKRKRAHAGFAELDGGQTLIIDFQEKKGFKGFVEAIRIDAEDREPYGEEILDETVNLEDCLKVLSYEELDARFLELDPEKQGAGRKREDDDDKKDDPPPAGRSRGRGAENDTEPPPSRTRGSRGSAAPAEDAPAGRRGRGTAAEQPEQEAPTGRRNRGAAAEPDAAPAETGRSSRRGARSEPEPEPEATPSGRRGRGVAAPPVEPEGECWVEGGVFGKDCDTHLGEPDVPNCYDCKVWDDCKAEQDKMSK